MKKLLFQQRGDTPHWVGDGFPVRSIFSYRERAADFSPFLLLDHAGPTRFPPSDAHVRGVGEHPHRGFETVTIVYAGEVEHRDSSGAGGKISAGDVQWMTAGAGLVHQEMHSADFARDGGEFEVVQLWVNLPAKDKRAKPGYQEIQNADIPKVSLGGDSSLRVIAGDYLGTSGPGRTFTPMNVWDLHLALGSVQEFEIPAGHTTLVFVMSGNVGYGDETDQLEAGAIGSFDPNETRLRLTAETEARFIILTGEPIREPIAAYGPFVMNSQREIAEAMEDFRRGRMGSID